MIFLNKSQRGVNLERGGVRERERERDPPVIHTKYSENFFFFGNKHSENFFCRLLYIIHTYYGK